MIIRQLFDRDSCTYTYLLSDEATREAVLIDPVFELHERDAALLRELDLTLKYTLDTHVHADHVTGAWRMREALGSQIAISARYDAANVDLSIDHGDVVGFGDYGVQVRATPGHTAGCVTYVATGDRLAFTGDALLIRGAGRTDFQGGSAADLYTSIREQILTLPDECTLYPAHDYNGRTMSTVSEEKRFNPRIGGNANQRDFVCYMDNLGLPHPRKLSVAVPANMQCGRTEEPVATPDWAPVRISYAGIPEVDAQWVAEHRDEVHVLDVRDEFELHEALGAIANGQCIPLSTLRDRVQDVPSGLPVVTVCHAGRRSAMAALILKKAGFDRVANLEGGMVHWRLLGLPTE